LQYLALNNRLSELGMLGINWRYMPSKSASVSRLYPNDGNAQDR
jgi:hypothetical protein